MALAARRHGHGGGKGTPGGGGVGGGQPNALLSWGQNFNASLGGGYATFGAFNFPQGVVTASDIAQISIGERQAIALRRNGTALIWGANPAGQMGFGFITETRAFEYPTQLVGGLALYFQERFFKKATGVTYELPRGPIGPVLPLLGAVAMPNNGTYALTNDGTGRVLAWGGNSAGQLSNGWEAHGEDTQGLIETGKWLPQRAPFWMLTGGPAQSESGFSPGGYKLVSGKAGEASAVYAYDKDSDPTWGDGSRSNVLRGVRMMAVAHEVIYLVKGDNEVWIAGRPKGVFPESPYAVKDPVLKLAPGEKIEAIVAGRAAYMLLLNTGQVRIVGINEEGRYGNGILEGGLAKREQATPEVSLGVPLSGVVAIGCGEYHCKALKSTGALWTWGSNREGQQGLGLPFTTVITRPTLIASLGTSVRAVDGGGMERGNGEFGGDTCIVLMADRTVRTWGINYNNDAGLAEHGLDVGVLGDNTFETHASPVKPPVSNISIVAAAQSMMYVVQEPATPYAGSLRASSPASRKLRIDWTPVPGTAGQLPAWRAAEAFSVRYGRVEGDPNKLNARGNPTPEGLTATTVGPTTFTLTVGTAAASWVYNPATTYALGFYVAYGGDMWKSKVAGNVGHTPAAGAFWERTPAPNATAYGAAPDLYEAVVVETVTTANPLPIGAFTKVKIVGTTREGALMTANAENKLLVTFAAPAKAEPGFYIEFQRNETFLNAKGKAERDHFNRSPLLAGNATSYLIDLNEWPSPHGLVGKELIVVIRGSFEGAYQRRECTVTVQA